MVILAAPLQGFTEAFFRSAHAHTIGSIDEYYAPFARLEKNELRKRDLSDLDPQKNAGVPVVPQILVRTADETQRLCGWIGGLGYARIDLNFCCPFPKVTQHGYGAGILPDAEAVKAVLHEAGRCSTLKISVKLRAGLEDNQDVFRLLPMLNDFPFYRIVLHPRTASQQYGGTPDHELFRRFAEQSRIKPFYNGDITAESDVSGLQNIMLGRGLLADPLLAKKLRGECVTKAQLIDFHKELLNSAMIFDQPLQKLLTLWEYLLPDAEKHFRKKVLKSRTLDEYRENTEKLFDSLVF